MVALPLAVRKSYPPAASAALASKVPCRAPAGARAWLDSCDACSTVVLAAEKHGSIQSQSSTKPHTAVALDAVPCRAVVRPSRVGTRAERSEGS